MQFLNFPPPFNEVLRPFAEKVIGPLNAAALLAATVRIESNWGRNTADRAEQSYMPGGRNYNAALYKQYGALAASSIGPFQFMLASARELGFKGHPNELRSVDVSIPLAVKYYLSRFMGKGGKTTYDAYRSYNGGNINAKAVPLERLKRFDRFYKEALAEVNSYLGQIKPKPITPPLLPPEVPKVPINILPFIPKKKAASKSVSTVVARARKMAVNPFVIGGVVLVVGTVLYFALKK